MKKKKKLFKYVVMGVGVILSIFIIFIVKNYRLPVDDMWQKYENTSYNFKFYYPSSLNITTDNKSSSFNVYLQDDDQELFRIHVYKPERDDDDEFKIREEKINNNLFKVLLFPEGLDSGDFKLNQPILYYITHQGGIKYSFQFNNHKELTPLERSILSTFEITPIYNYVPDCPKSNEILKLGVFSTDNFTIKIPISLSKKDTSFFVSPTWMFACNHPIDKTKGSESVRIYVETAGPFDIKTFKSKTDCVSYFDSLYSKNNSKFIANLLTVDYLTYSVDFNKCYLKYSLITPDKSELSFERIVLLSNSKTKPQQYDIYTYYPSNTSSDIIEALSESINSFILK